MRWESAEARCSNGSVLPARRPSVPTSRSWPSCWVFPSLNLSPGGPTSSEAETLAQVPLVSEVEAGNFTVIDNFRPHAKFSTVSVSVPVQRHTYALRVRGDSMVSGTTDSFPEGPIIIVEPELQPQLGDYSIAVDDKSETTFKQLIKDGGELFLKPLNLRYPIKPLGNATVIGVVREFTKRFR